LPRPHNGPKAFGPLCGRGRLIAVGRQEDSDSRCPPSEERYFTVAEVNALLPTLRESMERLQRLLEEARARFREMEMIKAVGYREDGTLIMLADYRMAKEVFDRTVG